MIVCQEVLRQQRIKCVFAAFHEEAVFSIENVVLENVYESLDLTHNLDHQSPEDFMLP